MVYMLTAVPRGVVVVVLVSVEAEAEYGAVANGNDRVGIWATIVTSSRETSWDERQVSAVSEWGLGECRPVLVGWCFE